MRAIGIEDLIDIRFMSGVALSPDGTQTAYVVSKQNKDENNYESWIHVLDNRTGDVRQLTYAGKESSFVWESESAILFASERGEKDKPEEFKKKTCFYRLEIAGGEAMKAFEIEKDVSALRPLGHNKYLINTTENLNEPSGDIDEQLRRDEKDYHVIEEIPVWANGKGYVSRVRSALFVYDLASGAIERISPEFFDVTGFDVGYGKIAYVGCEFRDRRPVHGEAYLYDINARQTTALVPKGKYGVDGVIATQSGALLALSTFEPYGLCQASDLYRYDRASGALSLVYDGGVHFGSALMTDCAYGGSSSAVAVGDDVYFIGQTESNATIYHLSAKNVLAPLFPFEGNVHGLDARGGEVVFVGQEPDRCLDLYRIEHGAPAKKTDINTDFFQNKEVAKAKYIPFTNSDGVKIEGWVLEPYGYDPARSYPGVLEIHGGPRCTFNAVFFHEMQSLAGAGYFVFFCNPRGSEGYGEDFADLRGKYGTVDYQDLMEFTDHALSLYPQIDRQRLGAAGGSYGGFMCNWIAGHTDRFAAIASQRSVSNWVSDFGSSEIGFSFDGSEMGATPWTDMQKMWDQSPLKYADRAKTPILFIHSLGDYNCTIDQGVEMFTAMKYFGVPSRMCVFEGENHSLSRSGKPRHRMRRLSEIMNWFDTYLKLT